MLVLLFLQEQTGNLRRGNL